MSSTSSWLRPEKSSIAIMILILNLKKAIAFPQQSYTLFKYIWCPTCKKMTISYFLLSSQTFNNSFPILQLHSQLITVVFYWKILNHHGKFFSFWPPNLSTHLHISTINSNFLCSHPVCCTVCRSSLFPAEMNSSLFALKPILTGISQKVMTAIICNFSCVIMFVFFFFFLLTIPSSLEIVSNKSHLQKMIWRKDSGKSVELKHQESVSPPRHQLHWQNLWDMTMLELWSLLKACNFQAKAWTVNCS